MDLDKLTTEQLKAMAFDAIVKRDEQVQVLNAIIMELNKRQAGTTDQ